MRQSFVQTLKKLLILILVGLFLAYIYHQSRAVIEGPSIVIEAPEDMMTLDSSLVLVRGHVSRSNAVYLNGRQIFTDTNGGFAEELLLLYGYNIIEVKATDQQGREVTEVLTLVYK